MLLCLSGLGILVASDAVGAPAESSSTSGTQHFIGDDLHLVREYTFVELINSWQGNWDPDNVETLAYRPIAVLFYNSQTLLFGENYYYNNI